MNEKLEVSVPGFVPASRKIIKCGRCKRSETEAVIGAGFPGWAPMPWLVDDKTGIPFFLCPKCCKLFIIWVSEGIKIAPADTLNDIK